MVPQCCGLQPELPVVALLPRSHPPVLDLHGISLLYIPEAYLSLNYALTHLCAQEFT